MGHVDVVLFASVVLVVILELSVSDHSPGETSCSFSFGFYSPPNGTCISSFLASGFSSVSHTLLLVANTAQPPVPCHVSFSESLLVSVRFSSICMSPC